MKPKPILMSDIREHIIAINEKIRGSGFCLMARTLTLQDLNDSDVVFEMRLEPEYDPNPQAPPRYP